MMGGTSGVLTADTRDELLSKAVKWYRGALVAGLEPRKFIYPVNTILKIQVGHNSILTGYLTIVDINDKPKFSETEYPFGIYSEGLSAEEKGKRFFGFVSAHS